MRSPLRTLVMLAVATLSSLAAAAYVGGQVDDRLARLGEVRGASWRVFAVDLHPAGPVVIDAVEEVRQIQPPPRFAMLARNRSALPITSFTIAAVVVRGDGQVIAIQPLPPIRNLPMDQSRRQETQIRVSSLSVSDRVAFALYEVSGEGVAWKADDAELRAVIKQAADRLPVP